jgi:hypothetical protein
LSVQEEEKGKENETGGSTTLANNRGKPLKVFLVSEEVMEGIHMCYSSRALLLFPLPLFSPLVLSRENAGKCTGEGK